MHFERGDLGNTIDTHTHTHLQAHIPVIRFLFVAKIFSDTENVRKYFTRINFTTKIFARWLAPGYTPALPQLLLPIYPCIRGSL